MEATNLTTEHASEVKEHFLRRKLKMYGYLLHNRPAGYQITEIYRNVIVSCDLTLQNVEDFYKNLLILPG